MTPSDPVTQPPDSPTCRACDNVLIDGNCPMHGDLNRRSSAIGAFPMQPPDSGARPLICRDCGVEAYSPEMLNAHYRMTHRMPRVIVHNHGPEDGAGLACREQLIGACRLDEPRPDVLDVARLRDALRRVFKSRYHERFAEPLAAEYVRLTSGAADPEPER